MKARIWVAQGRLTKALEWVREQGLSVDDDLGYLREFEHITLARMLIAQYQNDRMDGSIHAACGSWSACCKRRKKAAGWAA